jgi:putative transport protein
MCRWELAWCWRTARPYSNSNSRRRGWTAVALILGKMRRTGPMLWMPLPANIVLRNFGLAIFLATVGVNAGQPFVRTVAESGLTMLFIGVAVLLTKPHTRSAVVNALVSLPTEPK